MFITIHFDKGPVKVALLDWDCGPRYTQFGGLLMRNVLEKIEFSEGLQVQDKQHEDIRMYVYK